jgi:hypothetical protein
VSGAYMKEESLSVAVALAGAILLALCIASIIH